MYFIKCSFVLLCLSTGVHLSAVSDAFREANIPSDTNMKAPEHLLQVKYGNDDVDMSPGDKLGSISVVTPPLVTYDGSLANPDSYYTLVMFDPDVPAVGQFLHWLVTNIKGSDVETGDTITTYFPPGPIPSAKRISHRYTFLLFEQDHKLKFGLKDTMAAQARPLFDLAKLAEEHQLGDPKFGNYFNGVISSTGGIDI